MTTSRERFVNTLDRKPGGCPPYLEEGVRDEVLKAWKARGRDVEAQLADLPPRDEWVELQPEVFPDPKPKDHAWPMDRAGLQRYLEKRLRSDDKSRFKAEWQDKKDLCNGKEAARMLRVNRGFFQAMGVFGWQRFEQLMQLLIKKPDFVAEMLMENGRFLADITGQVLQKTGIEAAIFSEPIGGNNGPIISPKMYQELVLPGYEPAMAVLKQHGVRHLIFRTYANARILIPVIKEFGFNCLWACEVDIQAMDYLDIRREFGSDLNLIGGIDLDALRQGGEAITAELESKLPPLLEQGGYIPLADGRVREEVAFENYLLYRNKLAELVGS
jgi:hypothetical protein